MLFIFDKDGTLVAKCGDRPANTPAEQVVLPGVIDRLAGLRAAGHKLALATNQGGVAWGFISLSTAYRLAHDAAQKVGGLDVVAVCPYYPGAKGPRARERYARSSSRRKPRPGMLLDLMQRLGYDPDETVFIGDSETDLQAAEAAGVEFEWADTFFFRGR
jgi:D-glycero-D-manno-heptose 1,7-bisphosphate phosphatase